MWYQDGRFIPHLTRASERAHAAGEPSHTWHAARRHLRGERCTFQLCLTPRLLYVTPRLLWFIPFSLQYTQSSFCCLSGAAPGLTSAGPGGQKHNEYVVFHPDSSYPEYIVWYTVDQSGTRPVRVCTSFTHTLISGHTGSGLHFPLYSFALFYSSLLCGIGCGSCRYARGCCAGATEIDDLC